MQYKNDCIELDKKYEKMERELEEEYATKLIDSKKEYDLRIEEYEKDMTSWQHLTPEELNEKNQVVEVSYLSKRARTALIFSIIFSLLLMFSLISGLFGVFILISAIVMYKKNKILLGRMWRVFKRIFGLAVVLLIGSCIIGFWNPPIAIAFLLLGLTVVSVLEIKREKSGKNNNMAVPPKKPVYVSPQKFTVEKLYPPKPIKPREPSNT